MSQMLTELKVEIDNSTMIDGDFDALLSLIEQVDRNNQPNK